MKDKIKNRLQECATLFEFDYHGKTGNIDPYYIKEGVCEYLLFFDGEETMIYNIDDVMNTPFFDGKSLAEISDEIEIDSW